MDPRIASTRFGLQVASAAMLVVMLWNMAVLVLPYYEWYFVPSVVAFTLLTELLLFSSWRLWRLLEC